MFIELLTCIVPIMQEALPRWIIIIIIINIIIVIIIIYVCWRIMCRCLTVES